MTKPPARSSADERVRFWYAVALSRLAMENTRGALRALEAGLRVADEHRDTLGATELRVLAATGSADLAGLGLDLVLERRDAPAVLGWTERWRARSLSHPRAVPPANPDLARLLGELRQIVARVEQATLGEEPLAELEGERARLEAEIRALSLRSGSDGSARRLVGPPSVAQIRAHLGDGLLVEFLERDDDLYAVSCDRGACRLWHLGSARAIDRQRAGLVFSLSRLAYRRHSAASLEAAARLLRRSASALDDVLVGPVARLLDRAASDRRPIILVPTGELHSIPWSLLPRLSGVPLQVAPSASLLVGLTPPADRSSGNVVIVTGPGVATAETEVRCLRRLYPSAIVLEGERATSAAFSAALEGAAMAHIAAHGRFRSDNALFSALELYDGPLTVYDLETIVEPPAIMVLSACDAGRSQVHPGNELMGTTAALLSMGTESIVASVAPIPDVASPAVMARLHEVLLKAGSVTSALAAVQSEMAVNDLSEDELVAGSFAASTALAAGAFVCFGAAPSARARVPGKITA
ncbi:MAG: CHAT domain-containing protein [Acidimicrobiales bacterium]